MFSVLNIALPEFLLTAWSSHFIGVNNPCVISPVKHINPHFPQLIGIVVSTLLFPSCI
nr:MAG TPA: hypothetical protein [Caudoviricetes sp.]